MALDHFDKFGEFLRTNELTLQLGTFDVSVGKVSVHGVPLKDIEDFARVVGLRNGCLHLEH